MLNTINKNIPLSVPFINWEMYEYPVLPIASKQIWVVKTTNNIETPRQVILAFQTGIKNNVSKDSSKMNHCNITNAKIFLNSESYPYENLNLDLKKISIINCILYTRSLKSPIMGLLIIVLY